MRKTMRKSHKCMHNAGGAEDAERLRLLRACLVAFEGQHAFHNFTQRRLYRLSRREGWRQRERKLAVRAAAGAHAPVVSLHLF